MNVDRLTGAAVAAFLIGRALLRPGPPVRDLAQRLAAFPPDAPVRAPVAIHWNANQVPFIEAESLSDLAVALGMVHAHLRRTQMEIMRRLAQGRLSEMAGPLAIDMDRTLRLLDFPRAVPRDRGRTDARFPRSGRRGSSAASTTRRPTPRRAGRSRRNSPCSALREEVWTVEDLYANGRLAAADVNWMVWTRLLRARSGLAPERWAALWPTLLQVGAPNPDRDAVARHGSNAAAAAGGRTESGAAPVRRGPASVGGAAQYLARRRDGLPGAERGRADAGRLPDRGHRPQPRTSPGAAPACITRPPTCSTPNACRSRRRVADH